MIVKSEALLPERLRYRSVYVITSSGPAVLRDDLAYLMERLDQSPSLSLTAANAA